MIDDAATYKIESKSHARAETSREEAAVFLREEVEEQHVKVLGEGNETHLSLGRRWMMSRRWPEALPSYSPSTSRVWLGRTNSALPPAAPKASVASLLC